MGSESLEDRLAEFIERRESGEALTPEAFARERGGGDSLLASLRALVSTESLFPSGAPDLPARVGPYRVLGEIGRGGMGRVLEVRDPERPGKPVALKLLHVSLADQPRSLERFRREGKALERIVHPWVVRVHSAGLLDERPYLAMEKVEGRSLADHLQRARESESPNRGSLDALDLPGEGTMLERVIRLVSRIARAMAAAHREGVLHRDLNPRNVLVRPDGEPVVIDFGLMRASGSPTLTGSGDLLGTPQYMPPEQARGERVDERSDVFGIGAILWELLTLAPPRSADDTLALVREASSRPLGSLRQVTRGLPREVEVIARRATSFFPRWRYPSCEALATDLELTLEGEPIHARSHALAQACEWTQSHRRSVLVAGALLFALATGLLVRGFRSEEDLQRERFEWTNRITLPWLDGDHVGAQRALKGYLEEEDEPPFAEFLAGMAADDFEGGSSDPATNALLRGARALRAGRAGEARALFNTAWDLTPGYPMVLVLQGMAACEAGDFEAARGRMEVSTQAFGRSARVHFVLGRVYEGLELPGDAIRALTAAVTLDPGHVEAWLRLARAQRRLAEEEAALAAALRVLELDPANIELMALAEEWARDGTEALLQELRPGGR